MKAKSTKLRTLLTLYALFKYTDEKHPLNTKRLNAHLQPYGLECTKVVLNDTISILRQAGLDIRSKGFNGVKGVWVENKPLNDEILKQMIYTVVTNPYLSAQQCSNIFDSLRPLITVYQEPMLRNDVAFHHDKKFRGDDLFKVFCVVQEALLLQKRLHGTVVRFRYNKRLQTYSYTEQTTAFTPKCLYKTENTLYMVGYNHRRARVEAIDLMNFKELRIASKHIDPHKDRARDLLESINPQDYIPEHFSTPLYSGPAVFSCSGKSVELLVQRFGAPTEPVKIDRRRKVTYSIEMIDIYPETLLWLTQIPGANIRIQGPEALIEIVLKYYHNTSTILLSKKHDF